MPTKTWVVGEEVLAADFNAMVQKQVVATFANAAARDAALPAPTPGMVCYLNDTGKLYLYSDKVAPPTWGQPWGQPWGQVMYVPCNQPNTTGPIYITGSQVTLPYANRNYVVQFRCMATKDITAANVRYQINVQNQLWLYAEQPIPSNQVWSCEITASVPTGTPNTTTGVVVSTTAGGVDTAWGRMLVLDMGPV